MRPFLPYLFPRKGKDRAVGDTSEMTTTERAAASDVSFPLCSFLLFFQTANWICGLGFSCKSAAAIPQSLSAPAPFTQGSLRVRSSSPSPMRGRWHGEAVTDEVEALVSMCHCPPHQSPSATASPHRGSLWTAAAESFTPLRRARAGLRRPCRPRCRAPPGPACRGSRRNIFC